MDYGYFFYKSILHKNIEAEISEFVGICMRLRIFSE